jgi:cytochrome c biogenesis protein CcdA/thiol-disulfide isomerase/thioredoxin
MNLSFGMLTVGAGVLTVLSPCILPILPALLSASAQDGLRHRPFWIVLGLATGFTVFGVAFAVFGDFLGLSNETLRDIALAILLFFGASLLWPCLWNRIGARIGALAQRIPGGDRPASQKGRVGALFLGGSLGLVWTPCAGPVLGIILTFSTLQGEFGKSLFLMSGYSLGAAVPMLLIGYGGRSLYRRIASLGTWGKISHRILGAAIIATAAGLFLHLDTRLLSRLPENFLYTAPLEKRLAVIAPSGPGEKAAAPLAVADTSTEELPLPVLGKMPEFTKIVSWIGSPPLSAESLRGKVVVVHFWTYSCINCVRTLPYVTDWYDRYREDGFVVVGVHTPEFAFEKSEANVKKAIAQHRIHYPVALDHFYGTWRAYDNRYWPSLYLFDTAGRLRRAHFGEGEYQETERAIRSLLAEEKLPNAPRAPPRSGLR